MAISTAVKAILLSSGFKGRESQVLIGNYRYAITGTYNKRYLNSYFSRGAPLVCSNDYGQIWPLSHQVVSLLVYFLNSDAVFDSSKIKKKVFYSYLLKKLVCARNMLLVWHTYNVKKTELHSLFTYYYYFYFPLISCKRNLWVQCYLQKSVNQKFISSSKNKNFPIKFLLI